MRDKLIELLDETFEKQYDRNLVIAARPTADYLISHGVTFAKDNNVPCKFCQEDKDGYRAMFGAFSIRNPFRGSAWEIATGHCKPRQIYFCPMCGRKLSEPPKEGER